MSFRSREYYKEQDWDKTGIDIAFWNGHEKSDLGIRTLIVAMMIFDVYSLINSLNEKFTTLKVVILLLIISLMLITVPLRKNLTILHLEYKRIDIFRYKTMPLFKPFLLAENSVYLKDFKSVSLNKSRFRFSPHWQINLKFKDPTTTVKIPFRDDLPYRIHHAVYYGFKKKCSAEIETTLQALEKFYPYFNLQTSYKHTDFRYLVLLSYFLTYFVFSLIFPILIS